MIFPLTLLSIDSIIAGKDYHLLRPTDFPVEPGGAILFRQRSWVDYHLRCILFRPASEVLLGLRIRFYQVQQHYFVEQKWIESEAGSTVLNSTEIKLRYEQKARLKIHTRHLLCHHISV